MLAINSLGLFLFLGFLVATFVIWKQARISGLSEEKVLDTFFLTSFISLFVGRAIFVYSHLPLFSQDVSKIALFFKYPGLSLPGIIVAGVILSGLIAKNYDLEFIDLWDNFAVGSAFFALFGYLGFFLNGAVGPVPAVLALVLVGWLLFLRTRSIKKPGIFFLCYLLFQLVSLLIATWSNWKLFGIVLVIFVILIRYYDAISQKRSFPDKGLSGTEN